MSKVWVWLTGYLAILGVLLKHVHVYKVNALVNVNREPTNPGWGGT